MPKLPGMKKHVVRMKMPRSFTLSIDAQRSVSRRLSKLEQGVPVDSKRYDDRDTVRYRA
jgi:hypothetical protein